LIARGTTGLGLAVFFGSVLAAVGVAIADLPVRSGFDVAIGFGGFAGAVLMLVGSFSAAVAKAFKETK
jgi:hypothetical protein